MSHASMLKARRKRQKNLRLIEGAEKKAKRLAELTLKGPVEKKEKVKKVRVKKEKVKTEKVVKVKLTKEEVNRQDAAAKKPSTGGGKKGAA